MLSRKLFSILILIATINFGVILSAESTEKAYQSRAFESPHHFDRLPLVTAHKSYAPGLPPNSLAAVEYILNTEIGGIELDIQLSKDGVPVVFHDDFLEQATTGNGAVSSLTAEEIAGIHYLDGVGNPTPHPIPALEKILKVVGNAKTLFLDVKDAQVTDSGMARALAALIQKYNLYQTVVVESFNPVFLQRMRQLDPQILLQYDYVEDATATAEESPEQLASIPWLLKKPMTHRLIRSVIKPDILGVRFSIPIEKIRELSDQGYPMIAWTIDDVELAKKLIAAGVRGIQTNCPLEMQQTLQAFYPAYMQDASRLEKVRVHRIVEVAEEKDIAKALQCAKEEHKKISLASAQHTMGGHTFGEDHIVLKMHKYNKMSFSHETNRLKVQSGATWEQIQRYLDPLGRSVAVMQSDTIFSVGGSLSANVHGWQVGRGPIASTVHSFRLMLASGAVVACSRAENSELFRACLGGYGLFGVILDVEIETYPNTLLQKKSRYFPSQQFSGLFQQFVSEQPAVELAYGRLSIADNEFLTEASLNTYQTMEDPQTTIKTISREKMVDLKRMILRYSEYSENGKRLRWTLEKNMSAYLESGLQTRNTAMSPDIHVLWPVRNDRRDILQEYFIPKPKFDAFLEALKKHAKQHGMNLLNVTIREVRQDTDSVLAYAREDVFAFVLLFSQKTGEEEEGRMKQFTQALIGNVLDMGGTFYLPYRLHYTPEQFCKAYPMYRHFFDLKKQYDPDEIFGSQFWEHLKQIPANGL